MFPTERLLNKLREVGFSFDRQADRVMIYRMGTTRVNLPRKDLIPEARARAILEQAGVPPAEIEEFIACALQ